MYFAVFYFKTQTLVEAPTPPPKHVIMNGMNQEIEFTGQMETWKVFRWQHIKTTYEAAQLLQVSRVQLTAPG